MSIIQISKIQQRAGNLVDIPQLDNAQLGWAADARRLFIGRTGAPYVAENVEVITSYSNISFSQIVGSYGANLNFTSAENGQILGIETIGSDTYVVNKGGNAGGLVTLGTVSNVKITGGAIGYVLETDGTGNLNWTPKGYVIASIQALSNATPIIMTVANTTPFTNGTDVTITGVAGANANTIVNSQVFYVKVATDYPTSGNVELYTNAGLTIGAIGTNLTATPNTGTATFLIASSGGTASAGGSQGSVQFNNSGVIDGSSNLVLSGANLDLVGTFTAANIFANAGSISSGNLTITNRISAGGNITGGNLIGIFANGTSSIRIPTVNGNINMGAAGNTTVVVVTGTGANINGTLNATGTATANYFIATNSLNGYFLANAGTTVGKVYENGTYVKLESSSTYGVALASNGAVRLTFEANGFGGVGSSGTTGYALRIGKNTTGATTAGSLLINPTVQTDVTALATGVRVSLNTAVGASPYTITNLVGSGVYGGTIGANTTVTNQFGYYVDSTMTGATNNYGFYSGIASATGRYNLYMNGTANNYMAGNLGIGTTSPTSTLTIAGTFSVSGNTSTGANLSTAGLITAGGNITGANLVTSGQVQGGFIYSTDNIQAAGSLGVTGTASVGYLTVNRQDTGFEGGQLQLNKALDNNAAWYLDVYGNTGSPTLRFFNGDGQVRSQLDWNGQLSTGSMISGSSISAAGDITGGYVRSLGDVRADGTVYGGAGVSTAGTVTAGSIVSTGTISTSGSIIGGYVQSNGTLQGAYVYSIGDIRAATNLITDTGSVYAKGRHVSYFPHFGSIAGQFTPPASPFGGINEPSGGWLRGGYGIVGAYIYPPAGFSISNFAAGIVSNQQTQFRGTVDGNDTFVASFSVNYGEGRIELVFGDTETATNPQANYMFWWYV